MSTSDGGLLTSPSIVRDSYISHCASRKTPPLKKVIEQLEAAVQKGDKLTSLDVSDSELKKADALALAEVLRQVPTLNFLSMKGCIMDNAATTAIVDSIRGHQSLAYLDLGFNAFDFRAFKGICSLLESKNVLKTLVLTGCEINGRDLGAALSSPNCKIQRLDLSQVDFGFFNRHLSTLMVGLQSCDTVSVLNLQDNEFKVSDIQHISKTLLLNESLTSLNLSNNLIGDVGLRILSHGLVNSVNLVGLTLWNNQITAKGMKEFSKALRGNPALQILELGSNSIGYEGVKEIAPALYKNKVLDTVGLAKCNLGDEEHVTAAICLSELLDVNRGITRLDIRGNDIGVAGIFALSVSCQNNPLIVDVVLDSNNNSTDQKEDAEMKQRLIQTIQHNCSANLLRQEEDKEEESQQKPAMHKRKSLLEQAKSLFTNPPKPKPKARAKTPEIPEEKEGESIVQKARKSISHFKEEMAETLKASGLPITPRTPSQKLDDEEVAAAIDEVENEGGSRRQSTSSKASSRPPSVQRKASTPTSAHGGTPPPAAPSPITTGTETPSPSSVTPKPPTPSAEAVEGPPPSDSPSATPQAE